MLDTNMKTQLKAYLEKLTKPVELIATLDDSAKSAEIKELLAEIAELSDKVTFKEDNTLAVRKPSFLITNPGSDQGPRFAPTHMLSFHINQLGRTAKNMSYLFPIY